MYECKRTERREHVLEIILIDQTIVILVDHIEGLLELMDLREGRMLAIRTI